MKKKEFIQELKKNLTGLPEEDIKEILEDYREHFKIGKKKKRKETEIAKSLGDPKEIAKEARRELGEEGKIYFGAILENIWDEIKKTSKKIFTNIDKEIPNAEKKIKHLFKKIEKKKSKNKKRKGWKIAFLIMLNLFVMIGLWFSLFGGIISLIASSWSVIATGIAVFLSMIFGFVVHSSNSVNNLLVSGLFASIGIICMGIIFSIGTWKLGKGFFWVTGKYLKWNKKIFYGGKK